MKEEILTIEQVAKELKYSKQTIINWIAQGRFTVIKTSPNEVRIRRSVLDKFLDRHSINKSE